MFVLFCGGFYVRATEQNRWRSADRYDCANLWTRTRLIFFIVWMDGWMHVHQQHWLCYRAKLVQKKFLDASELQGGGRSVCTANQQIETFSQMFSQTKMTLHKSR